MIQGRKAETNVSASITEGRESVFAMEIRWPVNSLSLGELKRIHLQLGHCSENNLTSVLKAAQMHGGNH